MTQAEHAAELFNNGYNCAQAVAMAFSDLVGLEEKRVAKLASGFGGGMGRMREVCGAVSGMLMVYSQLYGYEQPDAQAQAEVYGTVQQLAGKFREKAGSIICREILNNPPSDPAPTPRTAEYYANRPCARMVYWAAEILEEYISSHPLQKEN